MCVRVETSSYKIIKKVLESDKVNKRLKVILLAFMEWVLHLRAQQTETEDKQRSRLFQQESKERIRTLVLSIIVGFYNRLPESSVFCIFTAFACSFEHAFLMGGHFYHFIESAGVLVALPVNA